MALLSPTSPSMLANVWAENFEGEYKADLLGAIEVLRHHGRAFESASAELPLYMPTSHQPPRMPHVITLARRRRRTNASRKLPCGVSINVVEDCSGHSLREGSQGLNVHDAGA